MVIDHSKAKRKISGGRYRKFRKKRLHSSGDVPTLTKIGKRKLKIKRIRSGDFKSSLISAEIANVFDGQKYVKTKIISVIGNPANRHYVRRNILTRGTIIKTEIGDAKITSRPGQDAVVNAVLVKK